MTGVLINFSLIAMRHYSFPKYLKICSVTVIVIRVESTKVQNSTRQGLSYKDIFILLGETDTVVKISERSTPWRGERATRTPK